MSNGKMSNGNYVKWEKCQMGKTSNGTHSFYECHSIESLNLSSFITSQIKNINFMLYNCKNLKILDIFKN